MVQDVSQKNTQKSRWARWASAVHMRCMACCVIFSVPGAELGAYLKVQSRCVPMFHPSPLYRLRGKKAVIEACTPSVHFSPDR